MSGSILLLSLFLPFLTLYLSHCLSPSLPLLNCYSSLPIVKYTFKFLFLSKSRLTFYIKFWKEISYVRNQLTTEWHILATPFLLTSRLATVIGLKSVWIMCTHFIEVIIHMLLKSQYTCYWSHNTHFIEVIINIFLKS